MKKVISFMFSRLFLVALMLVIQFALIMVAMIYLSQSALYYYLLLNLISFLVVIAIVSNQENPSYKLTWIISILTLPLTGGVFYLLLGNKRLPTRLKKAVSQVVESTKSNLPPNDLAAVRLEPEFPHLARQSRYICNLSGYPLFGNCSGVYFPVGEEMFERLLEELKGAERFIMLEYFIVKPGKMWNDIFDVLKQKARQGVEIFLMYDDLGSIKTMPKGYPGLITEAGIRLCIFNPFRPRLSMILNHRDHRKICVIDGKAAFCGGINLSDEYINLDDRLGHWKDTGVMLRGGGVWSFTFMFLQQWRFATDEEVDYDKYRVEPGPDIGDDLVQVFGDTPLDRENVTEIAYMNIIACATKYVYITSPYLVIDYEMEMALCNAARSGVDVRIITPYIYDKWFVHLLTRSHYKKLIQSGVKVYEYTPGFMHGKMFVADDNICIVGTCNMDFRSFYLHFECSVAFFASEVIGQVKQDMLRCQEVSHLVTLEETDKTPVWKRVLRAFLKIFAPLM